MYDSTGADAMDDVEYRFACPENDFDGDGPPGRTNTGSCVGVGVLTRLKLGRLGDERWVIQPDVAAALEGKPPPKLDLSTTSRRMPP